MYGYGRDPWSDQQQPAIEFGKKTATGRWVHRDKDIHRCSKPAYERGIKPGDRWECDTCHTVWRVKKVDYDQRDNSSWLVWEKYGEDTSGMYAPGTR
jgi:hypothetical protein